MLLKADFGTSSYDILIERGALCTLAGRFKLARRVLVVTDDGVPPQYASAVLAQCKNGVLQCLPRGESTKSFAMLERLCACMLEHGFTRADLVIAVGGGVIGDLAGLAAALYMRGVDFVNIPTTTLAQIDSSIGGKTAVNLGAVKNIVGSFYQPSFVLIDPDLLATLPPRHFSAGLVEALKAALLADPELFEIFEQGSAPARIEELLLRALTVKRDIVVLDQREHSRRALLNLGHTLGHGFETAAGLGSLLHGECVALGMLPMIDDADLRRRTRDILQALGVPVATPKGISLDAVMAAVAHDKKSEGDAIKTIRIKALAQPYTEMVSLEKLREKGADLLI